MSSFIQKGTATLVAGTVTISNVYLTNSDARIGACVNTPAGAAQGVKLAIPSASRTATSFVVNAVDATGATVGTDTSTIDWWII